MFYNLKEFPHTDIKLTQFSHNSGFKQSSLTQIFTNLSNNMKCKTFIVINKHRSFPIPYCKFYAQKKKSSSKLIPNIDLEGNGDEGPLLLDYIQDFPFYLVKFKNKNYYFVNTEIFAH